MSLTRQQRREQDRQQKKVKEVLNRLTPAQQQVIMDYYSLLMTQAWDNIGFLHYSIMREHKISDARIKSISQAVRDRTNMESAEIKMLPQDLPNEVVLRRDDALEIMEAAWSGACATCTGESTTCTMAYTFKYCGTPEYNNSSKYCRFAGRVKND